MTPTAAFSTHDLPALRQAAGWSEHIVRSYFPLDLEFRTTRGFAGTLDRWSLGGIEASRLRSDAAMYRRRRAHLRGSGEEEFLLTIPRAAPVRFLQMGREVTCPPGGFILERGNEPYEFSYGTANDLIVAKIGHGALARRLPDPGRFCAIQFDGTNGVGALLVDFLRTTGAHAAGIGEGPGAELGRQLVDLLALAIEQHPAAITNGSTSVRSAHLMRITREIDARASDPLLSPGDVAAACGVSVRYLHDLCQKDGAAFRDRLRESRLLAARRSLTRPGSQVSITEIALACGFSDGSVMARAYRARFGETPRETRAAAQVAAGGTAL